MFGRLQRHVAVLVVAQFMTALRDEVGEPLLLVKGGTAIELRRGIPGSRTSKDLDAVIRRDIEHVHDLLADVGESGWQGFTAVFTPPEAFDVPGVDGQLHRFTVKLSYHGAPFASVPVEVSPVEAGSADRFDALCSQAFGLVGLPPAAAVPCMTLPWQIAQKLHACTEPASGLRVNDRAHDLVDIQLLEALLPEDLLVATRRACLAVFAARGKQPWPPDVTPQPHWPSIYRSALEGLEDLGLASDVHQAARIVRDLVGRIDAAGSGRPSGR